MDPPQRGPTPQELQTELQRLREEIKEQQPSLLGAIRTLYADIEKWRNGERDYPRAAVLGVVFAYLRPRMVLVIGSAAALFLAAAQLWMLYRQNDLIAKQNELITGQSYALRAQTTAALLGDIDDTKPLSKSRLAMLLEFGDIGFDSLLLLAANDGTSGEVARRTLTEKMNAFEPVQQFRAFYAIFDYEMRVFVFGIASENTDRSDLLAKVAARKIAEVDALPITERLQIADQGDAAFRGIIGSVMSARSQEWGNLQKDLLLTHVAMIYAILIETRPANDSWDRPAADSLLSMLCSVLSPSTHPRNYSLWEDIRLAVTTAKIEQGHYLVLSVVARTVERSCSDVALTRDSFYADWGSTTFPSQYTEEMEY